MHGPEPPTATLLETVHSPNDGVTLSGVMRWLFAASYNQRVQATDSAKRYFMAALRYNHTESV